MTHANSIRSETIKIKTEKGEKIILEEMIHYIKANKKRSLVKIEGEEEKISCVSSLKWFAKNLDDPDFYCCHRSYLVNCNFVDCYCKKSILLTDNNVIPVSKDKIPGLEEILIRLKTRK